MAPKVPEYNVNRFLFLRDVWHAFLLQTLPALIRIEFLLESTSPILSSTISNFRQVGNYRPT